jgi:hypothetical protein
MSNPYQLKKTAIREASAKPKESFDANQVTVLATTPVVITNRATTFTEWGPHVPVLVQDVNGGGGEPGVVTALEAQTAELIGALSTIALELSNQIATQATLTRNELVTQGNAIRALITNTNLLLQAIDAGVERTAAAIPIQTGGLVASNNTQTTSINNKLDAVVAAVNNPAARLVVLDSINCDVMTQGLYTATTIKRAPTELVNMRLPAMRYTNTEGQNTQPFPAIISAGEVTKLYNYPPSDDVSTKTMMVGPTIGIRLDPGVIDQSYVATVKAQAGASIPYTLLNERSSLAVHVAGEQRPPVIDPEYACIGGDFVIPTEGADDTRKSWW